MSIATQLDLLDTRRQQLITSIRGKGVTMQDNASLADCVNGVNAISGGGGGKRHQFTGHVDADGLRAIGWTQSDIDYFQKNVNWDEKDDELHKVSAYNISLYTNATKVLIGGIEMASSSNFNTFKNDVRCRYFPKIDTSNMTNISFSNKRELEAIPNIDTSSVITMQSMFFTCYSLVSVDCGSWDTSSVTTMQSMFYFCSSLVSVDCGSWDTSSVTTMTQMFASCSSLVSVDCGSWDTSSVTTMSQMFYSCYSLISVDCGSWDTSSVTTMQNMFSTCYSLVSVDCGSWDTSSVTTMQSMFSTCSSLVSVDCGSWDTSSVTTMQSMFSTCYSLVSVDCGSWDTSSVTTMQGMFSSCYSLVSVDCGDDFVYNSITISGNLIVNSSSNSFRKKLATNFDSVKKLLKSMVNTTNQITNAPFYFESGSVAFDDENGTLANLVQQATNNGYVIYNLTIQAS